MNELWNTFQGSMTNVLIATKDFLLMSFRLGPKPSSVFPINESFGQYLDVQMVLLMPLLLLRCIGNASANASRIPLVCLPVSKPVGSPRVLHSCICARARWNKGFTRRQKHGPHGSTSMDPLIISPKEFAVTSSFNGSRNFRGLMLALGTPTTFSKSRTQQVPLDFAGRCLRKFLDDFHPPWIFKWSQAGSNVVLNFSLNIHAVFGVR